MWDTARRLAFEELQNRLHRRGPATHQAATQQPAHFVACSTSCARAGTDTTTWPYRRRRAALEELFRAHRLTAPWALCPSTTEADVVREWLTWASVGIEGMVFNRLGDAYRPSVIGRTAGRVGDARERLAARFLPGLPRLGPHQGAAEIARLQARELELAGTIVTHPYWSEFAATEVLAARTALKHHHEQHLADASS
ncbi:hypothetical protein [Streptomyces sp. NPDC006285]|uniref:hypothetical protein n=1 Tax=Streptomyces sp. NPDC006285 TaxID=3364742 RepID=UPI0036CB2A1B